MRSDDNRLRDSANETSGRTARDRDPATNGHPDRRRSIQQIASQGSTRSSEVLARAWKATRERWLQVSDKRDLGDDPEHRHRDSLTEDAADGGATVNRRETPDPSNPTDDAAPDAVDELDDEPSSEGSITVEEQGPAAHLDVEDPWESGPAEDVDSDLHVESARQVNPESSGNVKHRRRKKGARKTLSSAFLRAEPETVDRDACSSGYGCDALEPGADDPVSGSHEKAGRGRLEDVESGRKDATEDEVDSDVGAEIGLKEDTPSDATAEREEDSNSESSPSADALIDAPDRQTNAGNPSDSPAEQETEDEDSDTSAKEPGNDQGRTDDAETEASLDDDAHRSEIDELELQAGPSEKDRIESSGGDDVATRARCSSDGDDALDIGARSETSSTPESPNQGRQLRSDHVDTHYTHAHRADHNASDIEEVRDDAASERFPQTGESKYAQERLEEDRGGRSFEPGRVDEPSGEVYSPETARVDLMEEVDTMLFKSEAGAALQPELESADSSKAEESVGGSKDQGDSPPEQRTAGDLPEERHSRTTHNELRSPTVPDAQQLVAQNGRPMVEDSSAGGAGEVPEADPVVTSSDDAAEQVFRAERSMSASTGAALSADRSPIPSDITQFREAAVSVPEAGQLTGSSVLVAEVDDMIRAIISHRLERHGAHVLEAADGMEAVGILQSNPFDLAIISVSLPGLDGFEVLSWMRGDPDRRDLPVVMLEWPGDPSIMSRAFEIGADDFLRKPFSPIEMIARVKRLLVKHGGLASQGGVS